MSESLHLTRNGSILEITLDRPKANAIDAKTSFEMGEVFLNFVTIRNCVSPLLPVPERSSFPRAGI